VESTDTDFMCIFNYLIFCMLSTDKEEIQVQYHRQLNELMNQVCKSDCVWRNYAKKHSDIVFVCLIQWKREFMLPQLAEGIMVDLRRHSWIRKTLKGSTSGPNPWKICDDDDDV